jgi:hypothetical protein
LDGTSWEDFRFQCIQFRSNTIIPQKNNKT